MYVKKIKIFEGADAGKVEASVNDFFAKEIENGITILSVQYSNAQGTHYCMAYYTQEEKEAKK